MISSNAPENDRSMQIINSSQISQHSNVGGIDNQYLSQNELEDQHYATDNSKSLAYKLKAVDSSVINKSEHRNSKPLVHGGLRVPKKSPVNGRNSKFNIKNLSLTQKKR